MLNHRRCGKGPPLVLQHGFLGGSGYFAPQMAHLGRTHDVIAADLPGFAGSAGEPTPDSIEGLSGALVGFLDELGIERFALLGHSMGGMVALQTALDRPDRVERLILYGTSASGSLPGRFETFERSIERIGEEGLEATAARITATWFVEGEAAALYPLCLEAGRGAGREAAIACLAAMPAWDVSNRLDTLAMPTLVVYGDRDRSYDLEDAVGLARGIPGARLSILPDCAHNVHLEKSDLFNQVVADFLLKSA